MLNDKLLTNHFFTAGSVQDDAGEMDICVITPYEPSLSETFIRAHIEKLPARTVLIHGWRPMIGSRKVLSLPSRVIYKAGRTLLRHGLDRETKAAYVRAFQRFSPKAVFAEYGTTGVSVVDACKHLRIPLIVHFHGYDASVRSILEDHRTTYPVMFREAAAIVAVSHAMRGKLISLGATAEKVYYNPYGIDCMAFKGGDPATAAPLFVAVGRLVEKKAPQITLRAFSEVHGKHPHARLRIIGDGPLLQDLVSLSHQLKLGDAVSFLGAQSQQIVRDEMRNARCFVQHSIEAPSGDSEGTPLGILEAGASGLPVVSTRHAGIPDVVIEGETGFLVDEGDVSGMAAYMLQLAKDPSLAARLGRAARERAITHFSIEKSIAGLWSIIKSSIEKNGGGGTSDFEPKA